MATDVLTPDQLKVFQRLSPEQRRRWLALSLEDRRSFLEVVDQRIREAQDKAKKASSKSLSKPKPEGPPKPKDPPKPKPKDPPRKSDQARKVRGRVVDPPKATKPRRGVVREINKVKPEPKIEKLAPEKPKPKIEKDIDLGPDKTKSQKARKVLGKVGKQVVKKVVAPLAVLDAVHLAISEDAQQGAKDDFDAMGDDTAALRAVKSVLEPADTIYAAVSALRDAGANVSEPDYDQIERDTKVRRAERERELEKRYAAMSPEKQAVYDENRSAYKEKQRAKQLKRIMENRADAQRMIENRTSGTTTYGYRDEKSPIRHYSPKEYLKVTEKIAATQKAAADKAAAEKAAAEKAAADKAAADKAAADKAAADKEHHAAVADAYRGYLENISQDPFEKYEKAEKAEKARQAEQAEQVKQAEYAEFRDSSAEDYIKKLELEKAARRARLNKPLPKVLTPDEFEEFKKRVGN